jgi:2-polyprenyl-3-methyl-5-hydroxy-6-metoxy-1,4-benzoquinol methylase
MRPQDRENWRYSTGSDNTIDIEERVMFSLLPKPGVGKLLDVGCGVGTISVELQKRGFEVYGLDFSSVAIEKAKEKGINAVECDVDKDGIPFEDNCFDVVWAGDVVEHVFDPIFLFEEMSRVLKPTGKVLITTPNDCNLIRRTHIFISGKSPQSDIYRELRQCKHHTMFSLELLEYMLSEAGFSHYHIYSIVKMPKLDKKRFSKSKMLGALFGVVFIVEAYKHQPEMELTL